MFEPSGDWQAGLEARLGSAALQNETFLAQWLDQPPQTNEVGRSAVLIAFASALSARFGLPLALSELGASAGLNLGFDRFGCQVGTAVFGAANSPVILTPDWRGAQPDLRAFRVQDRRGCDLNPVDPAVDGLRLMAYVWPDQPARLARLRAALSLADGGLVDQADAADWLEGRLSRSRPGQCHLVYHTVAHQYFPTEVQNRIASLMQRSGANASADAPLAWFGMEADSGTEGAGLTLRLWPGDQRIALGRAGFPLGRAGFHGQWVDWRTNWQGR